jgi:hypothetical protein
MARPPDDPNQYPDDEPTAYANYGDQSGYGAYDQPTAPLPPPKQPWYRTPAALVALGAVAALILALIVYALIRLIADDSSTTITITTTPSTSTTTTSAAVAPVPTATETQTATPTQTTTTEPVTTSTTPSTTTTTTAPSISTSTSTSVVTETRTETQTVTESPTSAPPGP